MLKCELAQQLIADRLYDPLNAADEKALSIHLDYCADCRIVQQELRGALTLVRKAELTTPGSLRTHDEPEMESLWTNLQPELDRIDAQRYQQLSRVHRRHRRYTAFAVAASVVAVVMALILVRPAGPVTQIASSPESVAVEHAAPQAESADYRNFLNRARIALLSLANSEPANDRTLPFAREQAGYMAQEAGLLNVGLNNSLSAGQLQLLNDIQYLMLQYANLEDGDLASGMEVLRLFLNNNTLLFKLNLAELRDANPVI